MPHLDPCCGVIIQEIGDHYSETIYINIATPVCILGMILNLLNLLVFTRKTMNSPPNLILAHLAFADFLALITSIISFWIAFMQPKSVEESYILILAYWYNDISLSTLQFMSAFLTVQLAAWRYVAVVHPLKINHWCNEKITRNVVMAGYIICCVSFAVPYHLAFNIDESNKDGKTKYTVTFDQHPIMKYIAAIMYGVVIKLLPSVVLVGLNSRIIVGLSARKTRREKITSSASTRSTNVEIRQRNHRSTAILLAVSALFFIAEFPRAILWLLGMIYGEDWYKCFCSLVGIFITMLIIHTSVTFMVYYTLSEQFRTTFKSLFSRNPRTDISHQTHAPRLTYLS